MMNPLNLLGTVVLAGLTLGTTALAQAPGGGGQGGNAGRYAAGAVTAIDTTAGTITVTVRRTGASETLKVAAGTPIATQATVAIADLKVGDQIQVSGVPTNISASQIVAGDVPTGFPPVGGGPGGPGAGPGGGGQGGGQNGGQGGGAPGQPAYATATGKVTATSPMTIALSSGVTLTLTPTADARISRITTQTLANIKVGDQVSALGQTEADGTFTASAVGVNWTLGGFGGRGRRGQGGGRNGGGRNGGAPGQPAAGNAAPGGSGQ